MKRYFLSIITMALVTTSCNLDFAPSNEMTPEQLKKDPGGAIFITDGNYSLFKDNYDHAGYASRNSYVRHFFQMAEFPSDNTSLCYATIDPLYEAASYKSNWTLQNVQAFWWFAYRIIYGANSVIEFVPDGASIDSDYLKGENYFLRAICHLHLANLYSKPYSHGRDNLGIVIRRSTDTSVTKRESVGATYDQIVEDLLNAIRLMEKGKRRGNAGYASKEAAQGLLSRVYLYMEENQKVIDLVNSMLDGAAPASKLEGKETLPDYFAKALSSKETLWAVAHTAAETKAQSSIGSMYLTHTYESGLSIGWGEIGPSDPLKNLYERYPNDIRYGYVRPDYDKFRPETDSMIYWPVFHADNDFRFTENRYVTYNQITGETSFTEGSSKIVVDKIITEYGYKEYYINWEGERQKVRFNRALSRKAALSTIPSYFVTKFAYQDGDPMLSSPVMIRWAEVILNRAEAYAKLGQDQKALDDVNVLRTRAGLSGDELFTLTNMGSKGYTSVLDVVLDERRLELAFEGHRMFDLYRNKRDMDRRFAGAQPWEIVKWNDNKIQYPIPFYEISVSGIEQNPR